MARARRKSPPQPVVYGTPNFANRTLFQGDNLDVMRGINSETIDLIATDPPFNKGRDFHATPESLSHGASFEDRWRWEVDIHDEWVDRIKDDRRRTWALIDAVKGTDLSMAAYLCFMGVRLMEMERLLKPTGSLYLHCDPTASHYLKALMDTIFGRENFRNEIVWCYRSTSQAKRWFPRKHDNVLFYSKTDDWLFNHRALELREAYSLDRLPKRVNNPVLNRGGSGKWPGATDEELAQRYEKGKLVPDWWELTFGPNSPERTGYPTQKPLALYERIIAASSNPGEIVFDPFAGCATTCVAAERLGRQWIGADYWPAVVDIVVKRLNDSPTALKIEDYRTAVTHATAPPDRTDTADVAAPSFRTPQRSAQSAPLFTRDEMVQKLGEAFGWQCWACDYRMVSSNLHALGAFFHLGHRTPKGEGGSNELGNRCLLCPPCNLEMGDRLQLTALRNKAGYRRNKNDHPIDIAQATRWAQNEENKRREERIIGRTLPMSVEES